MKRKALALKLAFAFSAGLAGAFAASGLALAKDENVWTLTGPEEKKPDQIYLNYGVPESDSGVVAFRCKPKSGAVTVFIDETSEKLKAGKSATAVLSVGATKSSVAGKLMSNEDAGVPSFEGRLGAGDPIFGAMAEGETLLIVVGPSRDAAPLKGAGEKFRKFAAACARP